MSREKRISTEVRILGEEALEHENSMAELVDALGEKYKLTTSMCKFLLHRLPLKSDAACARKIGINPTTVMNWKLGWGVRSDCNFKQAYEDFWEEASKTADATVKRLRVKAADKIETLLEGRKTTYNKEGEVVGQEDDYSAISRGIELAMRWNRDWSERSRDEVDAQQVSVRDAFFDLLRAEQEKKAAELTGRVIVKELPSG